MTCAVAAQPCATAKFAQHAPRTTADGTPVVTSRMLSAPPRHCTYASTFRPPNQKVRMAAEPLPSA
eukprot:scaffold63203_cov64-Phaeocystis_antarctica.AAC.5